MACAVSLIKSISSTYSKSKLLVFGNGVPYHFLLDQIEHFAEHRLRQSLEEIECRTALSYSTEDGQEWRKLDMCSNLSRRMTVQVFEGRQVILKYTIIHHIAAAQSRFWRQKLNGCLRKHWPLVFEKYNSALTTFGTSDAVTKHNLLPVLHVSKSAKNDGRKPL